MVNTGAQRGWAICPKLRSWVLELRLQAQVSWAGKQRPGWVLDHPGRGSKDWSQELIWRQATLFSKVPEESNVKTGFEDNFSDLKMDYLLQNFLGNVLTIQIPDSTPNPADQNRWVEDKDLDWHPGRASLAISLHTPGNLGTGVHLMPPAVSIWGDFSVSLAFLFPPPTSFGSPCSNTNNNF